MLQPIEGFPDDVIAVRAVGQLTADDAQSVLAPAISRITAMGRKIRLVLEIGDDFDPSSLGGVFAGGNGGMADINSFEKLAFITDNDMFRTTIETFAQFMPAAVKVFSVADLEAARSWVGS